MKAADVTKSSRREHIPVRTCAGCRQRDRKQKLVRIARARGGAVPGGLLIDSHQRAPGRGSYVHPAAHCVERATRRGGLARQLRVSISPEVVANLRRELYAESVRSGEGELRSEASTAGVAFGERGQS